MLASVTHDLTDTLRKMHVAIASTTPDINWHPSRDPRPRRLTPLAAYTLGDSRRAPRLVVYHRMPSASLPPSRIRHLSPAASLVQTSTSLSSTNRLHRPQRLACANLRVEACVGLSPFVRSSSAIVVVLFGVLSLAACECCVPSNNK
ncbi:hypothetical protein GW17_00027002 [Ensete ventricosum]|nr:hypothetical protein GW17_00027002 [Ensete ventricosum]